MEENLSDGAVVFGAFALLILVILFAFRKEDAYLTAICTVMILMFTYVCYKSILNHIEESKNETKLLPKN